MQIATVDLRRILDETNAGKVAKVELEAIYEANKTQFEGLKKRFENAPEDKKQAAFQEASKFERESIAAFEQERSERRAVLLSVAKPLIEVLGKERELDAIIDANAMLYSKSELDLSDVLIERINAA